MTKVDRGENARKANSVLLSDEEKDEIQKALDLENKKRGLDLGLESKLRELGLLWARATRREKRR